MAEFMVLLEIEIDGQAFCVSRREQMGHPATLLLDAEGTTTLLGLPGDVPNEVVAAVWRIRAAAYQRGRKEGIDALEAQISRVIDAARWADAAP